MKKNKMMRTASGLLVATLLSTSIIAGTFAKYTSSASGSDSARVAKWEVTYQNTATGSQEVSLTGSPTNLSVTLFDYTDGNVAVKGAQNDTKVIAPGTEGSFSFKVTSKSEVAAKTSVTLTETNDSKIPIEYGLKPTDGDVTTWVKADDNGKINLTMDKTFPASAASSNVTETYTVCWRWAFTGDESINYTSNQTNSTDTTLGIKGTDTVTVNLAITAEQVN